MAVMQTPHGRVVGLILPKGDQTAPKAAEKEPEAAPKAAPVRKTARTAKK